MASEVRPAIKALPKDTRMNIVKGTDRCNQPNVSADFQSIFKMKNERGETKMRKSLILVGLFLVTTGLVWAQDFPKIETSPAFMYIRTPISFSVPSEGLSVSQSFNCAGGGGTLAYNFSSLLGIAADLGGCKYFGQTIPAPLSSKVNGSGFTFLFGPRLTL